MESAKAAPQDLFDLSDQVAIVTGGNGGLGLAIAEGLAAAGAIVVIAARNRSKADSALALLRSRRPECVYLELDVASSALCNDGVRSVVDMFGRLDVLVNNAGVNIRKRPEDLREDEWRFVLDVNLSGAFNCARAAYPYMRDRGRGKIINVGSMYSIFGAPYMAAYGASKGGVVQLTKSLACAWAPNNIQVNAILPGWFNTDLTQLAREQIKDLQQTVDARTPAGRWGNSSDIIGLSILLASQGSDFISGAAIPVDGGYSVRG